MLPMKSVRTHRTIRSFFSLVVILGLCSLALPSSDAQSASGGSETATQSSASADRDAPRMTGADAGSSATAESGTDTETNSGSTETTERQRVAAEATRRTIPVIDLVDAISARLEVAFTYQMDPPLQDATLEVSSPLLLSRSSRAGLFRLLGDLLRQVGYTFVRIANNEEGAQPLYRILPVREIGEVSLPVAQDPSTFDEDVYWGMTTYRLSHAQATTAQRLLVSLIREGVFVFPEPTTNSLVMSGPVAQLETVHQVLNAIDQGPESASE